MASEELPLLQSDVDGYGAASCADDAAECESKGRGGHVALAAVAAMCGFVVLAIVATAPADVPDAAVARADSSPPSVDSGGSSKPVVSLSFYAFGATALVQCMLAVSRVFKTASAEGGEGKEEKKAGNDPKHDIFDGLDLLLLLMYLFVMHDSSGFGIVWLGVLAGIASTAIRVLLVFQEKSELRKIRGVAACGGISFIILDSFLLNRSGHPLAYWSFAFTSLGPVISFLIRLCQQRRMEALDPDGQAVDHGLYFASGFDQLDLLLMSMYVFAVSHDVHLMWVGALAGLCASCLGPMCCCVKLLPHHLRGILGAFAVAWMAMWGLWSLWGPAVSANTPLLVFVFTASIPVARFTVDLWTKRDSWVPTVTRSGNRDERDRGAQELEKSEGLISKAMDKVDTMLLVMYLFVMPWSAGRISRTLFGSTRIGLALGVITTVLGPVGNIGSLQKYVKYRNLLGVGALLVLTVNGVMLAWH
eukprot:TRINITY_DN2628_c2_g1_i1.p1 TRINITY_DN2628_c2_g1~~TRINITY_DN2628_c2_g1_i1.p1  ORF type:complete len:475 (+),score=134.71 TRINITY_DN2628_c2_g1_i1:89-1513(+)